MGVWLGPMINVNGPINDRKYINYNGAFDFFSDDNNNWELILKSSGTLKFKKKPNYVDIFLVGAGANGVDGKGVDNGNYTYDAIGGKGGQGGQTVNQNLIELNHNVRYNISIGSEGEDTTMYGGNIELIAYGGNNELNTKDNGGNGASIHAYLNSGNIVISNTAYSSDGIAGTSAFNDGISYYNEIQYGAGGAGGGARFYGTGSQPWTIRNKNLYAAASGGVTGGGNAGWVASDSIGANSDANSNTGSGGAGGAGSYIYNGSGGTTSTNGSKGGSGIIIIRNHRQTTPSS